MNDIHKIAEQLTEDPCVSKSYEEKTAKEMKQRFPELKKREKKPLTEDRDEKWVRDCAAMMQSQGVLPDKAHRKCAAVALRAQRGGMSKDEFLKKIDGMLKDEEGRHAEMKRKKAARKRLLDAMRDAWDAA